tara:strand:+ start:1766 stop:2344 length:579 start_codon:yes stop_codon:yes gene_type:complete
MKKIKILLVIIAISFSAQADNNIVSYGEKSQATKIKIKIYSSLSCPYCAELHIKFLPNLIKKYVENKIAYIEIHDYPLNQSSLIAAQVQKCFSIDKQKLYLDEIYKNQSKWTDAKTLKELQANLSKITKSLGLEDKDFKNCVKNKGFEKKVLKSRIKAQNKYGINSTPTLIINEKKYTGSFKNIEKYIQKLL